jgi:hypothetical protein
VNKAKAVLGSEREGIRKIAHRQTLKSLLPVALR